MSRLKIPRQKSLFLPDVHNPFVHKPEFTWLDKLQIALMSVTLVPIRLLLIIVSLVIAWTFARIAILGMKPEEAKEPMKGWRKKMTVPVRFMGRVLFFACGFHYYSVKGRRVSPKEAPILICAPHSTFFDTCVMFESSLPSGVSRIENGQAILFGTLTRFTQPVFVSREDPNSRQNTIKEIKRRAHAGGKWPHIVIFPEGTCTNRTCLISFKPGAFYPGVPVQPVLIKYQNRLDSVTWTWEGPSAFLSLWYTLCQFHNKLEIEYLPVYHPSEEEKQDAKLYARNVRAVMAKALGVPMTDHTYEDIRLMNYASKLELPAAVGLVEFAKLSKKLGMNFENLKDVMDKFGAIAQKHKGEMDIEVFAEYLGLPVSEPLQEMFNLYDRDGSGKIDFREYVIGLYLVSMPVNNEETIELAFQLFDHGNKGHITEAELTDILERAFGMEEIDSHKLFHQVDADQDGKINYAEFKAYAVEKPEYAKLFVTYQELQAQNDMQNCGLDHQNAPEGAEDTDNTGSKVKAE